MARLLVFLQWLRVDYILLLFIKAFPHKAIFCFHELEKNRFEEQLDILQKIYEPLTLTSQLSLNFGELKRDRSTMALTLDDCLRRDMLVAQEVLKERNLPCTFFLPTNYASMGQAMWPNKLRQLYSVFPDKGSPDERIVTYLYDQQQTKTIEKEVDLEIEEADLNVNQNLEVLSWEEVKRIREDEPKLFSFQSHTSSHPKLSLLNKEELQEEFGESKSALLGHLDENQDVICYPYGSEWHIGDSYKVAASYYKFGLALIPGLLNKSTNPMYLPRIAFYPVDSRIRVLLKISMTIFKSILSKK